MRLIDVDQLITVIKEVPAVVDFDEEITRVVVRDEEYVPVVRCKDCLHWEPVPTCEIGVCHKAFSPKAAAETDFCSWGVRKEE